MAVEIPTATITTCWFPFVALLLPLPAPKASRLDQKSCTKHLPLCQRLVAQWRPYQSMDQEYCRLEDRPLFVTRNAEIDLGLFGAQTRNQALALQMLLAASENFLLLAYVRDELDELIPESQDDSPNLTKVGRDRKNGLAPQI